MGKEDLAFGLDWRGDGDVDIDEILVYGNGRGHGASKKESSWRKIATFGLIGACALFLAFGPPPATVYKCFEKHFYGSKASYGGGELAWQTCPDITTMHCATLTVPLDYTHPLPNETVSLFIRKVPATAPIKERLGTLFINPGGPGGSGSAAATTIGPKLSVILDGRYDILSWDPRGVNMTIPSLNCHSTESFGLLSEHRHNQLGLPREARGPTSWSSAQKSASELAYFRKLDAHMQSHAGSCEANGNQKMLRAVSTSFVVRDMVRILEALGEDKQGLSYWGFSYGTILGATFAAMNPHLVHRMVLDGVSDSVSYTNNMYDWGRSGMDDTHKTYRGFIKSCIDAGPACALSKPKHSCGKTNSNTQTVEELQSRIEGIIDGLIERPIPVFKSNAGSGILTASALQQAIFSSLYAPKVWPRLAQGIANAEKGDGTLLFEFTNQLYTDIHPKDMDKNVFHRYMEKTFAPTHTSAIMCSDSEAINDVAETDDALHGLKDYFHELGQKSPTGEIWADWVTTCRRWKHRPIEAYRGPWTVEDGLKKTKYPLIFASMTADPVTPLSAARSMSKGFGNESATLLVQEGFGHCTIAHPSLCTAKKIRAYFLEGKVPEYGTQCKADPGFLFPNTTTPNFTSMNHMNCKERKLAKALHELSGLIHEMGMGLGSRI